MAIHCKGVLLELKTEVFGNIPLPFFDGLVHKLFHMATIKANQMVMVLALIELVDGHAIALAGLKMASQ